MEELTKKQAAELAELHRSIAQIDDDLNAAWLLAELGQNVSEERTPVTAAPPVAEKAPVATAPAADAGDNDHGQNVGGGNGNKWNNGKKNGGGNKRGGKFALAPRTSPSFSELDTDRDGRLTLEEYKRGFPNDPNAEAEFHALDTDGDGTLSLDEYKAGHPDPPLVPVKKKKKRVGRTERGHKSGENTMRTSKSANRKPRRASSEAKDELKIWADTAKALRENREGVGKGGEDRQGEGGGKGASSKQGGGCVDHCKSELQTRPLDDADLT